MGRAAFAGVTGTVLAFNTHASGVCIQGALALDPEP